MMMTLKTQKKYASIESLVTEAFDPSVKIFFELMAHKVSEILLVSSPYDAFIMEEDGRLAERIIQEYRGLNLSRPPRITWVSTAKEALCALAEKWFDFVITMPSLDDMNPYTLAQTIKQQHHSMPVFLLTHNTNILAQNPNYSDRKVIDKSFVWRGTTDLLLAIVKNVEDRINVVVDTQKAKVRVIILVEDSPFYVSSFLPLLYKEIVMQTQEVMGESLNEEDRIVRMRARPKILLAENFEEALGLYHQFKPYLLAVFSDVRFQRKGREDGQAGFSLLNIIKRESPDIPLLVFSSEKSNRDRAQAIPAFFVNKNAASLHNDIQSFFKEYLGFGDFVFRLPSGAEVGRASSLRSMEKILPLIPEESIYFHATQNHFSGWLMARSEIQLASQLRPIKAHDFKNPQEIKTYLIDRIHERRKWRQKGVVADFSADDFDPETDFYKIGKGSLGGKARGIAFVYTRLTKNPQFQEKYKKIHICVPQTLVISTEGFDSFIKENNLHEISFDEYDDQAIIDIFLEAVLPDWLRHSLKQFLEKIDYPLAVRSSSLLEDAQFFPFAGLYKTIMLPNNHPDLDLRLKRLSRALKIVYASTYLKKPRSFARSTLHRTEEEKMAVVVQQLIGRKYGDYFYPAVSGVIQSYNFYPVSYMKPEEGIASIAFGLGKVVVEGEKTLRFSPKYPQFLSQHASVDDTLNNSQHYFYALDMTRFPEDFGTNERETLTRMDIDDAVEHEPVKQLCSTYFYEDHRIRDSYSPNGYPVMTFANILKHNAIPFSDLLADIVDRGRQGMGCPVEIEFALNLPTLNDPLYEFAILQIRPMAFSIHQRDIDIKKEEIDRAFCFSTSAMGNGDIRDISDIVFVKPDTFDTAKTTQIAAELSQINQRLTSQQRRYLLIGPGRWGSADHWLGIPVTWQDISGAGVIVEASIAQLQADPSQGTHFFHNITSLGISYITIANNEKDVLDWRWLNELPTHLELTYTKHIHFEETLTIKINGVQSQAVIIEPQITADTLNV
jgi:hypothetical protein